MKYITVISNLRTPKLKLSNVWDVDILFKNLERLGIKTLLTIIILTQDSILRVLLPTAHIFTPICMFTVDNKI